MAEFALVQQGARTTTGTQTYTAAGAPFGANPKGALFLVTMGVANGTVADHAVLAVGATDGTRNVGGCSSDKDAIVLGTSVAKHRCDTTDCILLLDLNGAVIGRAQFSAWGTDAVTINWSVAPGSAYLVTCLLLGGAGVANCYTSTAVVSDTLNAATDITAPNFPPTFLIGWVPDENNFNDTQQAAAQWHVGVATADGTQRSAYKQTADAQTGSTGANLMTSTSYIFGGLTGANLSIEVTTFDSQGFSTVRRNQATGSPKILGYLAVELTGLSAKIVSVNSPTATGSYDITGAGFTPQLALLLLGSATADNSLMNNVAAAEVYGIGLVAGSVA
jgi:hypothetical protein